MDNDAYYYDREGKPIDVSDWGRLIEDESYKLLKQEDVGKYWVSTVWVGINMTYHKGGKLIFETMIFCDDEEDPIKGYQNRYATEEEAREGHEIAVRMARLEVHRNYV